MNESNIIERKEIIDPLKITNKFILTSTYKNDIFFENNQLISCAGTVREIGSSVYNFKENELVGYISYEISQSLILSSNTVLRLNRIANEVIFILPFASSAMKILRDLNPKIGENIFLIGLNLFSLLLLKILKRSGANIYIINSNDNLDNLIVKKKDFECIFDCEDPNIRDLDIDKIILLKKIDQEILQIIRKISNKFSKKKIYLIESKSNTDVDLYSLGLKTVYLTKYDKGLLDFDYRKGIKYPYQYIRWEFKRNLEYFLNLVEEKYIDINLGIFELIKINSMDEIYQYLKKIPENKLVLFEIIS